MTWQDPIVAVIVGCAVVALYRHLRALVGSAAPESKASCHGCDDCAADADAPTSPRVAERSIVRSCRDKWCRWILLAGR